MSGLGLRPSPPPPGDPRRFPPRAVAPLWAAALALAIACPAGAIPAFGARHPALSPSGDRLAFDWRGDIWVASAEGGRAERLTAHIAHDSHPRWSPDGAEIAFCSDRHGNRDLFVLTLATGTVERLTFHSDDDWMQDWGPDGRTLYFGSRRESLHPLVYAVPRAGGRPVRVTGDEAFNAAVSPDGRWIAYVRGYTEWWRRGYRGPANRDLWVRALDGGPSWAITDWDGDDDRPQWSADSRALFFQSGLDGGGKNLYRQELRFDEGPDGAPRAAPQGPPRRITRLDDDDLQYFSLSRDGRWAAWESRGGIFVAATDGGEPRRVDLDCPADDRDNAITRRLLDSGATEYAFAPGEKQLAFVVEGEIYAAVVKGAGETGPALRLTDTDAREKDIVWLDEQTLLFVSDRYGQDDIFALRSTDPDEPRLGRSRRREAVRLTDDPGNEWRPLPSPDRRTILYLRDERFLWTMAPDGGRQRRLLDLPGVLHASWSPDSRFIAYSHTTLGYAEDVFVLELDGGRGANVSNHPNDDFHPLWSGDGKRLSWASRTEDGFYHIKYLWLTREEADKSRTQREREREIEEEREAAREEGDRAAKDDAKAPEVRIDWEDFPPRVRAVATVRGYYWDYDQSPDGRHYALRTDVLGEMELWTVDWEGDHLRRLTSGGSDPDRLSWSEGNDAVRYLSGGLIREIRDEEGAAAQVYGFTAELTVDAAARRLQKFHEAWRLLDQGFYDPDFHGCDWAAMRAKYEPLAAAAATQEDWNDAVRQMIGELSASHLGVYGPGPDGGDETGLLGFTPDDAYEGPGVRAAAVLRHGPLDREGRRVDPGDVILAVEGREIAPGANYYALLNHQTGKEIDLAIARGGPRGRRETVTIEPAAGGRIWELLYEQWTERSRRRVDELSQGLLGYVHMDAMGAHDWDRLIEDIFSRAQGKQGLILDVRNNNGGSIHDQVLTLLGRRPYVYSRARGDRDITYDAMWRVDGPVVLMTNERSFSDGEIFPAGFRTLGLGRIVGMPTFGGVIGTHDTRLIDGTGFRVPGTGWYRLDGTPLENRPVEPDLRVPSVPEENLRDADAQLEAAVRECLRMRAAGEHHPAPPPPR